jgi:hypothetical protein
MIKSVCFIFFFLVNVKSCNSTSADLQKEALIQSVQYQHWIAGVEGGGSGIYVTVKLEKPLPEKYSLDKIQIKDREAVLEKTSELEYKANIAIMTGGGKQFSKVTPVLSTILKPNEAKLYYTANGKQNSYIFAKAKEIPLVPYPSARPKTDAND